MKYLYDSYAVIEYLNNNENYLEYFESSQGFITTFNLVEIYYSVILTNGEKKADQVLELLYPLLIEPTKATIKLAMLFRKNNKKKKFSYADCIGYQLSLEKGIKFLTGDRQFRGLHNVEYIK